MNYGKSISPPSSVVGAPRAFSRTQDRHRRHSHVVLSLGSRRAQSTQSSDAGAMDPAACVPTPGQMSEQCHKSPTNCWVRGNDWKSARVGLESGSSGVGTSHGAAGPLHRIPVVDWRCRCPRVSSATSDFSTHTTSISLHAVLCWKQGRSRSIAKGCGRLFHALASTCPPTNTQSTLTHGWHGGRR